jgi:hypothetical protein
MEILASLGLVQGEMSAEIKAVITFGKGGPYKDSREFNLITSCRSRA